MKIIFLFPGYASQSIGMGKELYDEFRIVQEYFEEAANCVGYNFVKLCFASSEVELGRMEHAYTSIFLVSCAIAQLLREQGINPDSVAGYNNGEYAAIHTARGLTFPDGLYLLSKYATFYQEAFAQQGSVSGLRVRGLSHTQVQDICAQASGDEYSVYSAAYEQDNVCVVMGHTQAVDAVRLDINQHHQSVTLEEMPMEFGLHSSLMDAVAVQYTLYMEKVDFKDLEVPVYRSIDAQPVTLGAEVKKGIIGQVVHEIQWNSIVAALDEYDLVVQIGPGTVVQEMVKALYPEKHCVAINTKADIETLKRILNFSSHEQEDKIDANL